VRRLVPAVVALLFSAGCDSCDKKPTPTADAGPTTAQDAALAADAATAQADAGEGEGGAPKHDMGNCPTSVPGVTVAIKDVEGGVEVAVTGKDEATTKEIRERMKKLAAADKEAADAGPKQHDHSGGGGGKFGRCTILMRNTKLETAEIPNGAKAVVKAQDKSEVGWLRQETKDRDKEAKTTAAEGAGKERMAHCPSAVEGARTAVKDSKEGVIVTILGPPDKVGEIRERAKHVAEVAKKGEAGAITHTAAASADAPSSSKATRPPT
jgi:hypothetical protein